MNELDTIGVWGRALLSFAIALLLGDSARVLWPGVWRRKLAALPAALIVVCGAVSAYQLLVCGALLQQLGVIRWSVSAELVRQALTVPQIVLLLAAGAVFYEVRLRPVAAQPPPLSLMALANFRLGEQQAPLASSQQLIDAIASAIQSLFVQSQISESERRAAVQERDTALQRVDELRRMLDQAELIRFELQRQLREVS
jgi:hypothetical protein